MAPVLAIATAGVFLAGFGGHHSGDAPLAVPVAGAVMPLADAGTLPEGHPPLTGRRPGLPQGHPPLPEGHPPLSGADPVCPYRGPAQNHAPGSEPGPRADDAPIIST
jgi:hypothetical protein